MLISSTGYLGSAFAEDIIIKTSADNHDGRFFGEAVLQVTLIDQDADTDDAIDDIEVAIEAQPEEGSSRSIDIIVPETSPSSGRFEFFLVHADADVVLLSNLDPINNAGIEGDGTCLADCAPLVTFGPGADLSLSSGLYDEVGFEISSGNADVEVNYEETMGTLGLDRSAYGTTSFVYISITDQDANLNPHERDRFTIDPDIGPNDDLLVLDGGTFEDAVVFVETGDNTSIFEGRYELGTSIQVDTESLVLTLNEKANYDDTLDAAENNSNIIDKVSFIVGNSDGSIVIGGEAPAIPTWDPVIESDKDSYLVGDEVHLTITDYDANVNTSLADSVQLTVSSGMNSINVSASETAANTGVFEASFILGEGSIIPRGSAEIKYTDERPADYSERVQAGENPKKDFTLEVDIQLPIMTGTGATEVTAPEARDITGGNGPYETGNSVTLSTVISNNNEQEQPFVAIIEVRNSEGITVYLAYQRGTLGPNGSTDIGVLWQPESAGMFEVRTFAITSIDREAEPLSLPAASMITIG